MSPAALLKNERVETRKGAAGREKTMGRINN
jgi:hypothetical protein